MSTRSPSRMAEPNRGRGRKLEVARAGEPQVRRTSSEAESRGAVTWARRAGGCGSRGNGEHTCTHRDLHWGERGGILEAGGRFPKGSGGGVAWEPCGCSPAHLKSKFLVLMFSKGGRVTVRGSWLLLNLGAPDLAWPALSGKGFPAFWKGSSFPTPTWKWPGGKGRGGLSGYEAGLSLPPQSHKKCPRMIAPLQVKS